MSFLVGCALCYCYCHFERGTYQALINTLFQLPTMQGYSLDDASILQKLNRILDKFVQTTLAGCTWCQED